MRTRVLSILAYTAAGFMLLVAFCVPFVLMGAFTKAVAHAGLHIDAAYSGGTIARTIQREGYRIDVYQPVHPRMLERIEPFVQVVFSPAEKLPAAVNEAIDLDGDGVPDAQLSITVPADQNAPLHGSVKALNSTCISVDQLSANSFTRILTRSGDRVVVRVPLNPK